MARISEINEGTKTTTKVQTPPKYSAVTRVTRPKAAVPRAEPLKKARVVQPAPPAQQFAQKRVYVMPPQPGPGAPSNPLGESTLRFKSQSNPWSPPAKANPPASPAWPNVFANWLTTAMQNFNKGVQQAGATLRQTSPRQAAQAIGAYAWRNNPSRINPNTDRAALEKDMAMRAKNPNEIYGATYGPNWERAWFDENQINPATGQRFGANWRNELAPILMTPDEYARRRQAWLELSPDYRTWQSRAVWAASNLSPAEYNQWKLKNPAPSGFLQTEQERILRQNAAPTGYTYVPFGSGSIKNPSVESLPQEQPGGGGGGGNGGWGDYGGWGGGGGGGYYPDDYGSPNARSYQDTLTWYQNMTNWRVLQIQPG